MTRFRGRIPVSLADITGKAAEIAATLQNLPARDLCEARLLAEAHNEMAADAGWVPPWIDLTPAQRDRAIIDALAYLQAARTVGLARPVQAA